MDLGFDPSLPFGQNPYFHFFFNDDLPEVPLFLFADIFPHRFKVREELQQEGQTDLRFSKFVTGCTVEYRQLTMFTWSVQYCSDLGDKVVIRCYFSCALLTVAEVILFKLDQKRPIFS